MSRRFVAVALPLVALLWSPLTLVAFSAVVASVWLPFVYSENVPHLVGTAVVEETEMTDYVVVELHPDVYTAFEYDGDGDAPAPGSEVEIFTSHWNGPTTSASPATAWVLTVVVGALGLAVVTFVTGMAGGSVLESLHGRLERAERSHRTTSTGSSSYEPW